MKQSELDYKKETGLSTHELIYVVNKYGHETTKDVHSTEYIEWLEEKYETLSKQVDEMSMDWKSEYDEAVDEIQNLQKQLDDAESELSNLQYEIKELTGDK